MTLWFTKTISMSGLKLTRYILVLAMTTGFLYIVGHSLKKYMEGNIGETRSTKKAAEMFFPSIYICPILKTRYYLSHNSDSMNLTKHYESVPSVKDFILSIQQTFEAKNNR